MSDRRQRNPYRVAKREFRQEPVRQALRRAVQQSSGASWPSVTPAPTTRPEPVQAPATRTGATKP